MLGHAAQNRVGSSYPTVYYFEKRIYIFLKARKAIVMIACMISRIIIMCISFGLAS